MSGGRRGGERCQHAPPSVCTRRRHERSSHALRGRVLRSVLRPVHVDPHYAPQAQAPEVRRSNRHRGRANLRKQEEPAPGSRRANVARLAARHRSCKGGCMTRRRKGRRSRPPSLRGLKSSGLVARTSELQLQKSVGDVWPRISSANALQKERSGSSERGPSSERKSAGETVGGRVERRVRRESASPLRRARTGVRPRVARDRNPAAFTSPKAVGRSRDRGCKGHRILRRVPADGRHPGSSRASAFTRRRHRWSWWFSHPPTRTRPSKRRTHGEIAARAKASEARGRKRESRQGCQRLDRIGTVGRKRPRSFLQAVRQ